MVTNPIPPTPHAKQPDGTPLYADPSMNKRVSSSLRLPKGTFERMEAFVNGNRENSFKHRNTLIEVAVEQLLTELENGEFSPLLTMKKLRTELRHVIHEANDQQREAQRENLELVLLHQLMMRQILENMWQTTEETSLVVLLERLQVLNGINTDDENIIQKIETERKEITDRIRRNKENIMGISQPSSNVNMAIETNAASKYSRWRERLSKALTVVSSLSRK